uniref:Macrophage-expressed gene 1 protein n=1 Tax=Panagrolaimus davidi TaxID=227884 RepID=A0A914QQM1_9BILA
MNEIDQCISQMQTTFKNNDMIKTLAGLVGQGWNDLLSDYTLPVLATTFKKCLTDPDGEYLVPDNVFVIPVRDAEVERTSTQIDSFKEFSSDSSDKIGVSGSATVKGVQIGASFSSENKETKENYEKKNSIMFLNKVQYSAFDLMTNDDNFDEYFIYRLQQIAESVKNDKMLWAQFLSEAFISDFGTHVINQATAGAEIYQQTFIDRIEKFKGESNMQEYKAEVSLGFAKIAKLSIGYETKSEKSEKHFSAKSTTKSILKTKGGPDITRISKMEKNVIFIFEELYNK